MNLNKITPYHIETLGENFARNASRQVMLCRDDRVSVAQGILLNISNLADLVNNSGQSDRLQVLDTVTKVLGCCARIAEGSNSVKLRDLAPEIREQAIAFQPETA